MATCSHHDLIFKQQEIGYLCSTAAKELCLSKQELVNFFDIYWCGFDGSTPLLAALAVVAIVLIFKYTSITVDEYIAEGIQQISDWLGFSEALAAVTLLAFANGAGDVITALVASGAEGGVSYNIGALYGAGLFVCSTVVAICILQSDKEIIFDKMIIFRDVGIYLIATITTIALAFYGKFTWWGASILLLLYVFLVLLVIIEDYMKLRKNNEESPSRLEGNIPELGEESNKLLEGDEHEDKHGNPESEDKMKMKNVLGMFGGIQKPKKIPGESNKLALFRTAVHQVSLSIMLKKKLAMKKEAHFKASADRTLFESFSHYIEAPFSWILYLTALPSSKESYSKTRCIIFAIPGSLFWYYIFHRELDITYAYYPLPVSVLLMIIFYFALDSNEPPSWFMGMIIASVISGLMWTYLLIGTLIDLLNIIGVVFNLDEAFLGLTILAIGNALPDALTTIALCKQGSGTLAISGGYAGQLFGYLVGFGISLLKMTLKEGKPVSFELFNRSELKRNIQELIVLGVALFVLLYTFSYGVFNKFKMSRTFAYGLIITYLLFICSTSYFAIVHALKHP